MVKYIYNHEQAYYYMSRGVLPIDKPKINPKTNNIYFIFGTEETKQVYDEWCKRTNNK